MQSSLIPIKIVQQTPANLGTADLKFIGLADDSHQYAKAIGRPPFVTNF
jgi:hypothetical protein